MEISIQEIPGGLAPEVEMLYGRSFGSSGAFGKIQQLIQKNILIIQTSPMHTASTLLINALYGLIEETKDKKIIGTWHEDFKEKFDKVIVLKSHDLDIDNLIETYKNDYEVYFVCSERYEKNLYIEEKYKFYHNVVIFDYIELNETSENTILNIIDNIYNKVYKLLCKHQFIKFNKENAIKRIINMNILYNEIKNMSFDYVDEFYQIHGSHRNRITINQSEQDNQDLQENQSLQDNQHQQDNQTLEDNQDLQENQPLQRIPGELSVSQQIPEVEPLHTAEPIGPSLAGVCEGLQDNHPLQDNHHKPSNIFKLCSLKNTPKLKF
jgi:hypothetical protein